MSLLMYNQHRLVFILSHVSTNTKYIKLSDLVYTTRISIVILYKIAAVNSNICGQLVRASVTPV